jgi:5-methylcytosine-specific restriction endonuclease McrA
LVAEGLAAGLTQAEIATKHGINKGTVSYHAWRLGVPAQDACARRYDWSEIQSAYDSGLTVRQCAERFGFHPCSWSAAVRRGVVRSRPREIPIEYYLVAGHSGSRSHLRLRLFAAGLKENRCESCGLTDWQGEHLSMTLHHVNGNGTDYRLENLMILCPNCHAQTENFAGRGVGRRRKSK